MASTARVSLARPAPCNRHRLAIASGAPLAATTNVAGPSATCHTCETASRSGRSPYACTNVRSNSAGISGASKCLLLSAWNALSMGSNGSGRLASNPHSTRSRNAAGIRALWAGLKTVASASRSSATAIRFSVRVPVLSVHRTVADPKVSIAAARRVSTRAREIRHAPIAMNTVSTTGISSGNIDIPSAIPARTASSHPPRRVPYSTTASAVTAPPTMANIRTNRRVWACNRGASVCSAPRDWPILPTSLRTPVAVTSAIPVPRTTSEPENTNGRSSPPGRLFKSFPSPRSTLRTGTDSPVSNDSSVCRSLHSTSTASAGTRSPSASTIRSPRTTSLPAMRTRSPSRITRARGLVRSRRASSTCSVRVSCTTVIATDSDANTSRTIASLRSPSAK